MPTEIRVPTIRLFQVFIQVSLQKVLQVQRTTKYDGACSTPKHMKRPLHCPEQPLRCKNTMRPRWSSVTATIIKGPLGHPRMILAWSEHVRNTPVRGGYLSRFQDTFRMKQHEILCTGYLPKTQSNITNYWRSHTTPATKSAMMPDSVLCSTILFSAMSFVHRKFLDQTSFEKLKSR